MRVARFCWEHVYPVIFFINSANNISRKADMTHSYFNCNSVEATWWHAKRSHSIENNETSSLIPKGCTTESAVSYFQHSLEACSATFWYAAVVTSEQLVASVGLF